MDPVSNPAILESSLSKSKNENSDFCLGLNGRTMSFLNKPNKSFSVLDFLVTAVRMAGPKEIIKLNDPNYKLYRQITKSLLNKNCPVHFIKNKVLLAPAGLQKNNNLFKKRLQVQFNWPKNSSSNSNNNRGGHRSRSKKNEEEGKKIGESEREEEEEEFKNFKF